MTLTVTVPAPVPEAGLSDNQVMLSLALQLKVPPPVLLMLRVWAAGLLPPCWAVKDRLIGLVPIAGLTETTVAEGCDTMSAANLRSVRPLAFPFPELDELPALAVAASGLVPVGVVPAARDPVVVADDGATLMVARGTATPTLLLSEDGCFDREVVLSLCSDVGVVGTELTGEEPDGEGATDATGAVLWLSNQSVRLADRGLRVYLLSAYSAGLLADSSCQLLGGGGGNRLKL